MRTPTWQERLDECRSEAQIVEVARAYLASFEYWDIARLPDGCKPTKLTCGADVSQIAVALASYRYDERDRCAELIHRLAAFFIQAHLNLSRIVETTNDENGAAKDSA